VRKIITKHLFFICLSSLLMSFSFDSNRGIIFQTDGWGHVTKAAHESGKPIFIFIGTKKCGLSCRMEELMKNNNKVAGFYNSHFICTRMDPTEVITNFRLTNWGISQVPVMLFMNSKRKIIYRINGYQDAEKLIEAGNNATNLIDLQKDTHLYSVKNK